MAKAQLKLLLFLIVLGITLGCMATAYYIYAKVLKPETRIQKEIESIKKTEHVIVDPGIKRFDAAAELIKQGQIEAGREAMYKLIAQFPASPTCIEAKRIIGEINMDMLFSPNHKVGKRDYIVQPGDSLALIASKQGTSMDMIIRLNGLMGTTLQPGDHLTLVPLEFSVVVDVSANTVELRRMAAEKEYFFKEYRALEVRLPPGVKPPTEMEIGGKSAVADGKPVLSSDPRYVDAEKWLSGSRSGVLIRTKTPIKAVPVPEPAKTPDPQPGIQAAPAEVPQQESGIFLSREDLEELFALVRKGSKLAFKR
ncbi:MAG: LysM peptidoglycan-binding domain-containing protein [Prosthecobacter sp.]|nr:LysM peptidoglycan-binding domain-containing protein [Prosthecobacter sp.]